MNTGGSHVDTTSSTSASLLERASLTGQQQVVSFANQLRPQTIDAEQSTVSRFGVNATILVRARVDGSTAVEDTSDRWMDAGSEEKESQVYDGPLSELGPTFTDLAVDIASVWQHM